VPIAACWDAAADLLGGEALFPDGPGDGPGDLAHLVDATGDAGDGRGGRTGGLLNALDAGGDVLGGLCRLTGEGLDLAGDDGEPAPCLAGAGGLDGRVEGEQIRLRGDLRDQPDDAPRFVGMRP
jgi:hypothetical protein